MLVGWGWTAEQLRDGWMAVEELGFDACYVGDDLFPHPNVDAAVFDPWTTLPAMAVTTSRMRIGSLVSPVGRRHPALLAKMATGVDCLSGGRLIVGRGLGNTPEQQATVGQPYPKPSVRAEILAEELEIAERLWTQDRVEFQGRHYELNGAVNQPKPVSQPHPEVMVAFMSRRPSAAVAARFAQRVNILGADDERFTDTLDGLAGFCHDEGRSLEEIKVSRCASVVLTEDQPVDAGEALRDRARAIGASPQEMEEEHRDWVVSYVGRADGCASALKAQTYDLGCSEVVLCIDTIGQNAFDSTLSGLREFAAGSLAEIQSW